MVARVRLTADAKLQAVPTDAALLAVLAAQKLEKVWLMGQYWPATHSTHVVAPSDGEVLPVGHVAWSEHRTGLDTTSSRSSATTELPTRARNDKS